MATGRRAHRAAREGRPDDASAAWTAADVREWARQQGISIASRGRVPSHLVEMYLARPSVVRQWARAQGLPIGQRGPVPAELVSSYLTRPAAVRRWARERGLQVGKRGRIPDDVLRAYLDRFGDLLNLAA
ncbi:MAG TPA: histone-like nucleoid-structuring protein Lsr2 [Acidimicrobiales bacterium]|nr:histone-like nucleoid-structuring protein Lsr2 [Acidimicrobiales bacterium]